MKNKVDKLQKNLVKARSIDLANWRQALKDEEKIDYQIKGQ